jgi:hypothetical protein
VSTLEASDDASLAATLPVVTQTGRTRNALATLVGSISNTSIVALQAIVLVPLYLHALGAQLYGAWLATGDVLLWLQAFDLGLPNFLIQRVGAAHGIGDERTASEYLATGLVVLGIVAACVALIMWSSNSFAYGSGAEVRGTQLRRLLPCRDDCSKHLDCQQRCHRVLTRGAANVISFGSDCSGGGVRDGRFAHSDTFWLRIVVDCLWYSSSFGHLFDCERRFLAATGCSRSHTWV